MPRRPPREWLNQTISSLAAAGASRTPQRLAAWIWHHGLTPQKKREIFRGERRSYEPRKKTHMRLDPEKLPKPIDLRGYDHTLIRLVPEIDQLMELQIQVPAHIWDELREIIKGWTDVEVDEKNRRIVRRGRINAATNMFVDSD